jgi:urea carboxylase
VERLAQANFKDAGLFLEKYVERARHIEVQVFGDGQGRVLALGERDCSVQRRNQKVIEETPAPGLSEADAARSLQATAVRLGQAVNYRSAGTVEFVYDADTGAFYFLEVNTRLQVEHGVTEQVTGTDLVEWMVLLGAGDLPARWHRARAPRRLHPGAPVCRRPGQELPAQRRPAHRSGVSRPMRVDTWVATGSEVPPYYDPMLAKLIVTGHPRGAATEAGIAALAATRLYGIETNLGLPAPGGGGEVFREGRQTTR